MAHVLQIVSCGRQTFMEGACVGVLLCSGGGGAASCAVFRDPGSVAWGCGRLTEPSPAPPPHRGADWPETAGSPARGPQPGPARPRPRPRHTSRHKFFEPWAGAWLAGQQGSFCSSTPPSCVWPPVSESDCHCLNQNCPRQRYKL